MFALLLVIVPAVSSVQAYVEFHEHGLLIVGGDHNYPPYEFLDEDGNPTGFNVDLTKAVAKIMGMNVTIVLGPWDEIKKALESEKIDFIQGMFYSKERDRVFDFSPPHSLVTQTVFRRKGSLPVQDISQLKGKELIVMDGDIMHDYLLKKKLTDKIITVETQADALKLLLSGWHDAVLGARLPGLFWIDKLGLDKIISSDMMISEEKYCFAVKEGNLHLLNDLSEGLYLLKVSGQYHEIYEKWFGVLGSQKILTPLLIKYALFIILPLLVLLFVALLWSWTLRRQVFRRTVELSEEIISRKNAEKMLLESEEKLRTINASANDAIIMIDNEGKISYWNKAAERIFGYSVEEITGKDLHKTIAPQRYYKEYKENFTRFSLTGQGNAIGKTVEMEALRKNGEEFPIELSLSSVMLDEKWNAIGILRDITRRKKAEKELKTQRDQLEALYETGKKVTSIMSRDELLPWIAEQAARLLHAEGCHYRLREGDDLIRGSGYGGSYELMKKEKLKIGESLSGLIVETKKHFFTENLIEEERYIPEHREVAKRLGYVSYLGVPMMIGDRVIGVINICTKKKRIFVDNDIRLLSAFANHAALGIEKISSFEQTKETMSHFIALYEVNKTLTSELEMDELLPQIADQAKNILNADGCNFRLREGDELVLSHGTELALKLMTKKRIRVGESLSGIVAKEKKPLSVEDLLNDERYIKKHRELAKRLGISSLLGVPMLIGDEIIGVLHIFSKKKRKFSDSEVKLALAFAIQAAIAVRNARYLQEIRNSQDKLVRAEKLASVGRLASSVAHEILNPMNIISAKTQFMLLTGDKNEELKNNLRVIQEQVQRVVKISRALTALSREKEAAEKTELDINEIVTNALHSFEQNLTEEDNIHIKAELKNGLPHIRGDKDELLQVFSSILKNAAEAMPDGGGITVSTEVDEEKNGVLISFADTGHGISKEDIGRIFDPFFTTKSEIKDVGLGLTICYGIIENHGGRMWAENNREGKGTTFFVELPLNRNKGKESNHA